MYWSFTAASAAVGAGHRILGLIVLQWQVVLLIEGMALVVGQVVGRSLLEREILEGPA